MTVRRTIFAALCAAAAAAVLTSAAPGTDGPAVYYLSLGDSLAASWQPDGDLAHGYAERLYASLARAKPRLRLVKLGCPGESTASMRYGTQDATNVLSCATPRGYKRLYPRGTQLAQAISFLEAHKGKVALVTIDVGGDDLLHFDAHGKIVYCPLDPAGCGARTTAMARNLAAILSELEAAAGPGVPIVGMTYDDVVAPRCMSNARLRFACRRFDAFNRLLANTYAAAGVPAADVGAAFENDNLARAAEHVCAWTWFCARGDFHPNRAGYRVIAKAFERALPPGFDLPLPTRT